MIANISKVRKVNVRYIPMDPYAKIHKELNGGYTIGKWAIIQGREVINCGFDTEWDAINHVRKYINSELADMLELRFSR